MSATEILNDMPVDDGKVDVPTGDVDRALQTMQVKQRKNKRKQMKDPNAPKRASSAYMIWLNENRSEIKDELLSTNPDAKITDVTKRAGVLWGELSDDEKAPFQERSEELRAAYHEAMKAYKPDHIVGKKSKETVVKYDVDEIPSAPEAWSGPHTMRHLLRKVAGIDGKTVRIQKNFDAAVALANEINAAWTTAVEKGDVPTHWKHDVKPCAGITKTSTGYDLRLGPDMVETLEKDSKGGLASWTIGANAPVADESDAKSPVVVEQTPKTPDAPKKKKVVKKKTSDEEADVADAPKKKLVKKKAKKLELPACGSQYTEIEPDEDEDEEDDSEAVTLVIDDQTNYVYNINDLKTPVGKNKGDIKNQELDIEFFPTPN